MSEFGAYLEALDPVNRTEFAENGAEYFADKLIADVCQNSGAILVAEEEGKIIGFIGGFVGKQSEEELMEAKKAVPGIISEFFITTNMRAKGVGAQLLQALEAHLKTNGCTLIRLEVFAPNSLAREFYARHGYQDRTVVVSKEL